MHDDGSLADYKIKPTQLKNVKRLTYDVVDKVIANEVVNDDVLSTKERESILTLADIAEKRKKWRASQGSLSLQKPKISM